MSTSAIYIKTPFEPNELNIKGSFDCFVTRPELVPTIQLLYKLACGSMWKFSEAQFREKRMGPNCFLTCLDLLATHS